MKDFIKKEVEKINEPKFKRLALGEILQHLILQSLYRHNAFDYLTFTGGTALRLLYNTKRYSEDLDFSLTGKNQLKLEVLINKVQSDLILQGINCNPYIKSEKTMFKSDLRFSEILQEFNLSSLKSQKFTIKVEIDKNPPKEGHREIMLITTPISYTVSVFDLSSLFATKLHAIFYRKYTKGRDYYDLLWFLGRKIKPNFNLLNNAIKQTQGNFEKNEKITESNFRERVINHLESIDFKAVQKDIERFLINQEELNFIKLETIKSLLREY